ncbi:hypothetical protein LP420_01565 [Massilia sp. B-10]|nr:hypothetical protein LP420_01565 [Massilia sp. B-10]
MLFVFALLAQGALHLPFQLAFAQSAFNYWAVAWTFMMIPVLGWWMSRSLAPASQRRVDIGMVVLFFPCLFVAIACVLAAPVVGEADDSYVLVSEAQAGWAGLPPLSDQLRDRLFSRTGTGRKSVT